MKNEKKRWTECDIVIIISKKRNIFSRKRAKKVLTNNKWASAMYITYNIVVVVVVVVYVSVFPFSVIAFYWIDTL